jgi:hypothetical protein
MATRFVVETKDGADWKEVGCNLIRPDLTKEQMKLVAHTVMSQTGCQVRIRKVVEKVLFTTTKPQNRSIAA